MALMKGTVELNMKSTRAFSDLKHIARSYLNLVSSSFGPKGLLVPVSTSLNNVILTTDGITLAGTIAPSHPFYNLISKALNTHHQVYGGAIKSFIIILSSLLTNISDIYFAEHLKQGSLQAAMKQELLKLNFEMPSLYEEIRKQSESKSEVCLLKIIQSFFTTKFSSSVSSLLSSLMYQLISKLGRDLEANLTLLEDNFDFMCVTALAAPTQDSRVMSGILLEHNKRSCKQHRVISNTHLGFIIFYDEQEDADQFSKEVILEASGEDLNKYSQYSYSQWRNYTDNLKKAGVHLLLSTKLIQSILSLCCLHSGIAVIDGLADEEIKLLVSLTGLFASDPGTGRFSSLNCLNIGSEAFVHMELNTEDYSPHTLVLCAPTATLCKQYFNECRNCLKTVLAWYKDTKINGTSSACQGNGVWEMNLARLAFKKRNAIYLDSMAYKIWKAIGDSVLSVARILHENSGHPGRFLSVWHTFQINGAEEELCTEPTVIKEATLSAVIALVIQIVGIEGIVKARRINNSP